MAKLLMKSVSKSSLLYSHSVDLTGYGRLGPDEKFDNGEYIMNGLGLDAPAQQAVEEPSGTFLGRMRAAYENWMLSVGSASGEFTAVPVAKASRAPAALTSVVSTWIAPPSSEKGTKITDLDPGFKLTAAERKYLEHIKRTAASRKF